LEPLEHHRSAGLARGITWQVGGDCRQEVRVAQPPFDDVRQGAAEQRGRSPRLVRQRRASVDYRDDVLEVVARDEVAAAP
jgi:hypothetical protein